MRWQNFKLLPNREESTVVHRGLSPDSVRLCADGQPLFAGWRWARLPRALTIADRVPGDHGSYTAPEVRANGLAFADARSDIYSLSKVLSDLFRSDDVDFVNAMSALEAGVAEEPSARSPAIEIVELLELVARLPAPPHHHHPPSAGMRGISSTGSTVAIESCHS